jgi:hypothetical protein
MAVNGILLHRWDQFGNTVRTFDVFIGNAPVFAFASLAQTSGGGTQAVGIAELRTKATPVSAPTIENFGAWPNWPPTAFRPTMNQVTFGAATGQDQVLRGHYEIYFT